MMMTNSLSSIILSVIFKLGVSLDFFKHSFCDFLVNKAMSEISGISYFAANQNSICGKFFLLGSFFKQLCNMLNANKC